MKEDLESEKTRSRIRIKICLEIQDLMIDKLNRFLAPNCQTQGDYKDVFKKLNSIIAKEAEFLAEKKE